MKFPVFDLHCDTALALIGKDMKSSTSLRKNNFHIDLERASRLPGYCQCFACFTTPGMQDWYGISPMTVFDRELDTMMHQIGMNNDLIRQAFTAADVRKNMEEGKMSAILTVEGPAGFGFDPALLETLYKAGVRITSLGWNEKNVLCGSHRTGGGLTDIGKEYIKEAQRLGMIIDVSHCSDEAFWDMMKVTNAPIVATHSNSRAVCGVSRNLTDDMFRAIRDCGGVVGINYYRPFVGDDGSMDALIAHIEHFLALDGENTVCLGGDMDGCEELAGGMQGLQDVPKLYDELKRRGYSDALLEDIFWNNLERLL